MAYFYALLLAIPDPPLNTDRSIEKSISDGHEAEVSVKQTEGTPHE